MRSEMTVLYLGMAKILLHEVEILGEINQKYFEEVKNGMEREGAELFVNTKEELDEIFRNSARILSLSEELDIVISKVFSLNSSEFSISEER